MIDAENLAKLLSHLKPERLRRFLGDEFVLELPELDTHQTKTEQRKALEAELSELPLSHRQAIEEVAEKIILLTDGPGQDVVEGFRVDVFDDAARAAFDAQRDQYERALWLYENDEVVFKGALDARQADVFRQNMSCYSGFVAPKHLQMITDESARLSFHDSVAEHLGCPRENVAVQVFKRLRPDTHSGEDVELYQISVHHNRPPEIVDCVQASELVAQNVIRAVSSHITYEPTNGHLEVLSKETDGREALARIVADALLHSPFSGEKIPLKCYDYQSLAAPRNFDVSGEDLVASVKVTELGYADDNHRSLLVKIWAKDPTDIYDTARVLIGPTFDFRDHHLNYARLSIRLKKNGKERARTLAVVLRDDNKCNIKTKREKDRALCDRLLARWGLVKEIGDGSDDSLDALAA
ncbi:MAG: hypothetical protein I4O36_01000 [Ralstonia pickettii]|nr:hypothetical protein [Ralstonia pickettii]